MSVVEEGLYPTGTEVTSYFIELEPVDETARTLVATTADLASYDYERNVELLDEMFRTIEFDQPGPANLVATYQGGGAPFDVIAEADGSQTCLTVDPGEATTCLAAPTGNRANAEVIGGAIVGLAGPDVFRIEVQNGVSFLPVPTESGTFAWAVPFDGSTFDVLGTDGDTIRIHAGS